MEIPEKMPAENLQTAMQVKLKKKPKASALPKNSRKLQPAKAKEK